MPLVGRREACATAVACLEAAARGQSGLLLVRVGPGAGKTFFTEWLMQRAEEAGFTVASGYGVARSAETLKPFLDVIRSSLAIGEAVLSDEEVEELVVRHFREEGGEVAATGAFLARAIRGEELVAVPSSIESSPKELSEQIRPHRWYRVILRMAAASPLLVVIEDLHLTDPFSIELLSYLAGRCHESGARVLFCGTIDAQHAEADRSELRPLIEGLVTTRGTPYVHALELGNFSTAVVIA